ncbi:uncharacterized protein LOC125314822 [Rhodamnia argentea]|uniref:Uncharacterized protein LOC125314822 n=1 Tax=Rhodamnia argentea TaxID=178133 RepID=A0ABM3HBP1_9MYRT|nr:uncharacterized protein LOC125314822 [Rhodamnia argentea]
MATLKEDFEKLLEQKLDKLKSKVLPRAVVNETYRSLFEAVLKGDWKAMAKILDEDGTATTAKVMTIGSNHFAVLEVATMAAQDELVENLVQRFPGCCKDVNRSRALCYAARGGRIRIVKALVDKVNDKPEIIADALQFVLKFPPLQNEVIWYLARRTTSPPTGTLMVGLIFAGHLDVLLYLAGKYPGHLGSIEVRSFLEFLVLMNRYFRSGARLNFWEKSIYKCIPQCLVDTSLDNFKDANMDRAPFIERCRKLKLRHNCSLELAKRALAEMKSNMGAPKMLEGLLTSGIVLDAASRGVFEIVDLCLKHYPELMWDDTFAKELIKTVVKGRHVELFRLVNAHTPIRSLLDSLSMNVDLMDAVIEWSSKCVSPDVSGAAFVMQRELQWFQVSPLCLFPFLLRSLISIYTAKVYYFSEGSGSQQLSFFEMAESSRR